MSLEKHPLHLKNPELQISPDVQDAVAKKQRLSGERVPNNPTERIDAYVDRLENVFLSPDERVRERNLDMLRDKIHDALIIRKENFPESYFELQKRVAREQGHGDIEITPEMREQMMDVAIEDQRHSLDAWIDYLASPDAVYPAWFKYYAWNQIIKLSQFDKERGEFKKRTASTVAPYPDIYREPLAQIADLYERVKDDNKDSEARKEFDKKFPSLYAELIQKTLEQQAEGREEIKGRWVKYEQNDTAAAEKLFASLEGKGTGWCTAGRSTAETQIKSGDFYVYYTNDASGAPTQPRLAIRMNGTDKIGEVRGVLPHQNVEPLLSGVLEDKLAEFGHEADRFHKKSDDMRHLTALEQKHENDELFTKDDLIFLYEVNSTIEGFGYQRDPRIEELRNGRNAEEDMLVIFECTKNEIARNTTEITENTRAYVGNWNPQVYQTVKDYPNIQHLYESFPDKKIFIFKLETDPNIATPQQAEATLKERNIYLSGYGKDLLYKTEFSTEAHTYNLVQFTVAQLGFPNGTTTNEIYAKAQSLGLKLCPAEIGPRLRLAYPGTDWKYIAMKQISDADGYPDVFYLDAFGAALELHGFHARPGYRWDAGPRFVFRT